MSKNSKNEKIKGLLVKRGKKPVVIEIDANDKLSAMQKTVGGLIDCIELYNPNGITDIIFNDEGKINGICKPNRTITFNHVFGRGGNKMLDVVYGDFLLLGVDDEGDHVSLTDSEIRRWSREFANPKPPIVTPEQHKAFLMPRFIPLP